MHRLNPTKNEQNLQFSDVCILVQGTTNESETNKINISCSSQLIVLEPCWILQPCWTSPNVLSSDGNAGYYYTKFF